MWLEGPLPFSFIFSINCPCLFYRLVLPDQIRIILSNFRNKNNIKRWLDWCCTYWLMAECGDSFVALELMQRHGTFCCDNPFFFSCLVFVLLVWYLPLKLSPK
jgi:hypothetical protein